MTGSPFELIARGVALGIAIVLPIGPMKMLCLRRILAFGWLAGAVTAAGVVSGDAIFATLAACGLTALAPPLQAFSPYLRIAGGTALLWLALGAVRRHPGAGNLTLGRSRLASMYAGTVGLTLSNPSTIVGFATVLLSAGGLDAMGGAGGGLIAAGIILGSTLVWIAFTTAAIVVGRGLAGPHLVWFSRAAAAIMLYYAIVAIWNGVASLTSAPRADTCPSARWNAPVGACYDLTRVEAPSPAAPMAIAD